MFCVLNEAVNLTLIMHAPRRPSLTERVESALQKLNEAKELRVWLNLDTVVALCPSLSEEDFKGRGGYMTVTSGRSDLERGFHTHVLKRKLAHVHIFDRAKALDAGVLPVPRVGLKRWIEFESIYLRDDPKNLRSEMFTHRQEWLMGRGVVDSTFT